MTNSKPTLPESISDCPSQAILREYLIGKTDESLGVRVDLHLESCRVCNEAIQALECEIGPTLGISDLKTDSNSRTRERSPVTDKAVPGIASVASLPLSEVQIINDAIMASKIANKTGEPTKTATKIVGPYRLLESIGRGGMGEVYRAEHIKLKKRVAIKLLPLYVANAIAIERFEREIQAAGKLNHPSIVHSTDAGVDSGYQYLAMEYIDGIDLGRLGRRIRDFSCADVCEMGRQIALGLAHAHAMGMVHRDIKPSNVMLDTTGKIKLLDFGLVLLSQWDSPVGELTTVGQFLGTLDYMAPEQAERSGAVDHRSDLYSLGATLFRLLTGQLPLAMLPNQSPLEKLRSLTNHSPVRIQTLRKDLPNDLASFIDRLLSTDPKDRPESAARVAESLEPFCQGANLLLLSERAAKASAADEADAEPRYEPKWVAANRNGRRKGASWWTVAMAACLPLVAYFGIVLILEDSQGNLVIQSEVDEVRVRLVTPDGNADKQWQVQQGNSMTKLLAGRYEISIDAPSDTVSIDKSTMIIKKGETVIARVSKQEPDQVKAPMKTPSSPLANQAALSGVSKFPLDSIPKSFLSSTYEGKTLEETIRSLDQELSYKTWLQSLTILENVMPPHLKTQFAPFIIQTATEKRFISNATVLRLRDWLSDEAIDNQFSLGLAAKGDEESLMNFLNQCGFYHFDNAGSIGSSSGLRQVDWTKLSRTWRLVEDALSIMGSVRQGEIRLKVAKLPVSVEFSDFLFERYPNTAFTFCDYFETKPGFMGDINHFPLEPKNRGEIRLKSRIRLAQSAIDKNDKESFFYQMAFVVRNLENISSEREYWQLVGMQVGRYLQSWAKEDRPVLQEGVPLRLAMRFGDMNRQFAALHSSVLPEELKRGGMGGGMGGGSQAQSGSRSKASLSIELIGAYLWIPEEFRPKAALEEVRSMLAMHLGDTAKGTDELFPMTWNRLQWNDQFRLEYFDDEFRQKRSFPADQLPALEAFALHRWVGYLLDADQADPDTVCYQFVEELRKPNFKDNKTKAAKWIVARGRDSWQEQVQNLAITSDLSTERVDSWARKATVTGRFNSTGTGTAAAIFQLELESEGWRIRNVTIIDGVEHSSLVDF